MLVDNEVKSSSNGSLAVGIAFILAVFIIFAIVMSASGGRDDKDCKEWGVEIDDRGRLSWAPIPYTPRNKDDAEHIARQLQGQDIEGGRYYTAKCKEYK